MAGEPGDVAVMTFDLVKRMQVQMDRTEGDVQNTKVRMSSVEVSLGQLNTRMDRFDGRTARIERRLNIVPAAGSAS